MRRVNLERQVEGGLWQRGWQVTKGIKRLKLVRKRGRGCFLGVEVGQECMCVCVCVSRTPSACVSLYSSSASHSFYKTWQQVKLLCWAWELLVSVVLVKHTYSEVKPTICSDLLRFLTVFKWLIPLRLQGLFTLHSTIISVWEIVYKNTDLLHPTSNRFSQDGLRNVGQVKQDWIYQIYWETTRNFDISKCF